MNHLIYTPIQIREVFHLEFLRWLGRKLEPNLYALKGGVNLRFFFKSIRYSEDMDIDVQKAGVERIKKLTMDILNTRGFLDNLRLCGILNVTTPDMAKAKQTETTQRFKVHLLTACGEDLFTKIEFSRRGMKGKAVVEPVSAQILRSYKMAPLLVSHYDAFSAVSQKVQALAERPVLQARDIFDLFILSSQLDLSSAVLPPIHSAVLKRAHDNIFLAEFSQFRDAVVAYLEIEDQKIYALETVWDEIKLKTAHFLEEFKK